MGLVGRKKPKSLEKTHMCKERTWKFHAEGPRHDAATFSLWHDNYKHFTTVLPQYITINYISCSICKISPTATEFIVTHGHIFNNTDLKYEWSGICFKTVVCFLLWPQMSYLFTVRTCANHWNSSIHDRWTVLLHENAHCNTIWMIY